jgi:NDP-sugar pyrophosphorylase family protein
MTPGDTQVVVMAGGLATRLGEAGRDHPKALQPVNGTPFLDIMMTPLLRAGFRRFCFCLGHMADQVVAHLERHRGALSIRYHVDKRPRGTGGSLLAARALLDDTFLLVLGDTYLDIGYAEPLAALPSDALGLIIVTDGVHEVPGNIELAGDLVTQYDKSLGPSTRWVDTGALVLRRRALDLVSGLACPFDLGELFVRLIGARALRAWPTQRPFYDIGTPERLSVFTALAPRIGTGRRQTAEDT